MSHPTLEEINNTLKADLTKIKQDFTKRLQDETDRMLRELALLKEILRLNDEVKKGRDFKQYVHSRLDIAGVPVDPNPTNTAATGCRIEGRLTWLISRAKDFEA